MKKITGFFMAILPFFVLVLLFISGFIIKNNTHVWVQSVTLTTPSLSVQKKNDKVDVEKELSCSVLPKNANNPEVLWTSSDPNVVSVVDGELTCKSYGEVTITATSKENKTIYDTCKVDVWDDEIHSINITNEFNASYVGVGQTNKINAIAWPSTHLTEDPTLLFTSSDNDTLEVQPDGSIIGKKEGKATITISSKAKPAITRDIEITVGKGVYLVEFDNASTETIASQKINLLSNIKTYPDENIAKDPNNFIFKSSDEAVATIDAKGNVKFNKEGLSDFTITYKRDPSLYATKSIYSTALYFKDVSFNRYEYVNSLSSFENNKYINASDLNWYVYPLSNDNSNLEITTSNDKVVKVGERKDNFPLEVVGAGQAILTAKITTGNPEQPTITDYCLVTIKDDIKSGFLKEGTVNIDNCYYYLNNNLKFTDPDLKNQKITWSVSDTSIANIDKYNIVHFTKAGSVVVSADTGSLPVETFTLTSSANVNDIALTSESTYVIEVGKKYKFTSDDNYQPQFDESQKQKMTITEEDGIIYFIPHVGNSIEKLVLEGNLWAKREINLIITEKPLGIDFNKVFPYYYTTSNIDVNFKQLAQPTIIPTTCMQSNGRPYTIDYKYDYDESKVSVEGEEIKFKDKSSMSITLSVGELQNYLTFVIKSTNKEVGKFDLLDGTTRIYSGTKIVLHSGEEKELVLNDLFATQEMSKLVHEQLSIKAINENDVCKVEKEEYDPANPSVKFKLTGSYYGTDTVIISSGSYKFFINVEVTPFITDFYLTYNYQLIGNEKVNKTYTNNLKLKVYVSPISALLTTYTATLNSTSIEVGVDNTLDLSNKLNVGKNTLVLTSGVQGEPSYISKTYEFNYVNAITNDSYTLDTLLTKNQKNYVYLKAAETQNISHIVFDGIVEDSVYDNFKINYQAQSGEKLTLNKNLLQLDGVISPSVNTRFENKFTIKYGTLEAKEINFKRQVVSRIVLPRHDNESQYDKAGLQKVRVYGNTSFYNNAEGQIDFYKLPIELYDYKNELIEDDLAHSKYYKKEAFNDLEWTASQNAQVEYKFANQYDPKGYLAIKFNSQSFYTTDQIYNDEFAKVDNKNVKFSISTPLKNTKAEYSFVTVSGNNVYCQDAIGDMERSQKEIVLQTNFGKEGAKKENAPFVNGGIAWFTTIYGNGHTINFNARSIQTQEQKSIRFLRGINLNIVGMNQDTYKNNGELEVLIRTANHPIDPSNLFFAYSSLTLTSKGLNIANEDNPVKIKNCLFYENKTYSINLVDKNKTLYIQNCVFFNCSSFAITVSKWAEIYLKGFIDFYNFRGQEMLKDVGGYDISFLWDLIQKAAKEKNMLHIDSGRPMINSCLVTLLSSNVYFWDEDTQTYMANEAGNPYAAQYLTKLYSIHIPILGDVGIWATPKVDGAPKYSDEFDPEGQIQKDFLNQQIEKVSRKII